MDFQTQMNGNGTEDAPSHRVVRSAAASWHHALVLGELQFQLLLVEFSEGFRQVRGGLLLVVGGLLFGIASVPVVLVALALLLVEAAELTPALAFGSVAGLAILTTTVLLAAGWGRLHGESLTTPRSRAEWKTNWRWLKETLARERQQRKHPFDSRVHSP